jgi:hypothetical protein
MISDIYKPGGVTSSGFSERGETGSGVTGAAGVSTGGAGSAGVSAGAETGSGVTEEDGVKGGRSSVAGAGGGVVTGSAGVVNLGSIFRSMLGVAGVVGVVLSSILSYLINNIFILEVQGYSCQVFAFNGRPG